MLEFYPSPVLTHQGLLQGHHHDTITNSISCNGHGRTGKQSSMYSAIDLIIALKIKRKSIGTNQMISLNNNADRNVKSFTFSVILKNFSMAETFKRKGASSI